MTRNQIAKLPLESRRAELAAFHANMFKDHLAGFDSRHIAKTHCRSLRYVQFVLKILMRTINVRTWSTEDCARIDRWVSNHTDPLRRVMKREHDLIMAGRLLEVPSLRKFLQSQH